MRYEEFVDQVRRKLGVRDPEPIERVVIATLSTLGQRINKVDRQILSSPLEPRLKQAILRYPEADRFDLEEFYNRVGARANVGYAEAVEGSRAVIAALRELEGDPEMEKVLGKLPSEYRELFGEEPTSALSPTNHKPGAF